MAQVDRTSLLLLVLYYGQVITSQVAAAALQDHPYRTTGRRGRWGDMRLLQSELESNVHRVPFQSSSVANYSIFNGKSERTIP